VDPRAVLDTVVKKKIPSPRRESKPRTPIIQPVAQGYEELRNLYVSPNIIRMIKLRRMRWVSM
jgi:hypothetical protein